MFDPYHKWLGIPKDQRPPTHYQLLGLAPNETDAEVIDEAAVRQTTHVRAYQIGPHAAECTKLLNEIAQAKLVLLNPAKRKAYDEQLAKSQESQISARVPAVAVGAAPAPAAFRFDEEDVPIARPPRRDLDIAKPPKSNTALVWILAGVGAGVVLLLGTIVTIVVARRPEPVKAAPVVVVKKEEKKELAPILQIPEDPKPPIVKPPIVQPPIVQPPPPPPMDAVPAANVPGARSFRIKENRIEFLSLAPDGSKVAAGWGNPGVFDVTTGQQLPQFPWPMKGGAIHTPVAFHPDNRRVFYAWGCDPAAVLGEAATGLPLFRFEAGKNSHVLALAVSPDGKRGLTSHSNLLVLWDLTTQQEIKRWPHNQVFDIAFTPDSKKAVTGELAFAGSITLWDLDKLDRVGSCRVPQQFHALAVSPDGAAVATGSKTGVALVDLATLQPRTVPVPGNENGIAVAFHAGGKQLLTGGKDGLIRVWDVATLKEVAAWQGHAAEVSRIAVDAKERIAVSGDRMGTVFVWPLPNGPIVAAPAAVVPAAAAPPPGLQQIVKHRLQGVFALAILPDGKSYLAGGLAIEHWDMNGTLRQALTNKRKSTSNRFYLSLLPDGKRAIWGENQDSPSVVEIATGRELGRLMHPGSLNGMAVSPDGARILAGFNDGSVVLWDVNTQQTIQELPKQTPHSFSMGFTRDGKQALVIKINGNVQAFNAETWQPTQQWTTAPFPGAPLPKTRDELK